MNGFGQVMDLQALRFDPRMNMSGQLMSQGLDSSPIRHPLQGVSRMAQALLGAKMYQDMIGQRQAALQQEQMKQQAQRQALSQLINPEMRTLGTTIPVPEQEADFSNVSMHGQPAVDLRVQGQTRGFSPDPNELAQVRGVPGMESATGRFTPSQMAQALMQKRMGSQGPIGYGPVDRAFTTQDDTAQFKGKPFQPVTGGMFKGPQSKMNANQVYEGVGKDPGGAFAALNNFQDTIRPPDLVKKERAPVQSMQERLAEYIDAGGDPVSGMELLKMQQEFQRGPQEFETVESPFGRGGVGQRDTRTGQIVNYQGPQAKGGLVKVQDEDGKAVYKWESEAVGQQPYEKPTTPKYGSEVPYPQDVYQQKLDIAEAGADRLNPLQQTKMETEKMRQEKMVADEKKQKKQAEMAIAQFQNKVDIVQESVDQAIDLIDKGGVWGLGTTGWGNVLSVLPDTDARTLNNTLDTIKANVGFDQLQAMRDASPTGGALGQVSENENRLLQAINGALDPAGSAVPLKENLNRIKDLYPKVMREKKEAFNATFGGGEQQSNQQDNKKKLFWDKDSGTFKPNRRQ